MMELPLLTIVIALASVLVSLTIHEAMHAFTSYWLGDNTAKHEGRLTFNPLAHIDLLTTIALPVFLAIIGAPIFGAAKPVPFNPERLRGGDFGAAAVALAGPLSNLILAALAGVGIMLGASGLWQTVLLLFMQVNVGFFIFNMIPFPPLDGSRLLYAVAPEPVRGVMRSIESLGFVAILVFIFIFYSFLSRPFSVVMINVMNFLTGGAVRFS